MKPCHDNNGTAILLEGRLAQSFVLMFSLQLNILVTGMFLLVSCSNTFQNLNVVCAWTRPMFSAIKNI